MRAVVLGAGTVGTWIAELLCQNRHSVTVVDSNPEHAKIVNEELDVRALTGSASQSSVLFQADVLGADICLAVTGNDEVNLIAASMAKALGARRSIARCFAPVFRDLSTFDYQRHFKIDRLLSLEHLTAAEFAREIRHPDSAVVEHFARGELEMQEVTVNKKSSSIGTLLRDLELPKGVRIGSIYREDKLWIAGANDSIRLQDKMTLIGQREDIDKVRDMFEKDRGTKIGVVIAGGGETGYHLARMLEGSHYAVVLMEQAKERCDQLAVAAASEYRTQ